MGAAPALTALAALDGLLVLFGVGLVVAAAGAAGRRGISRFGWVAAANAVVFSGSLAFVAWAVRHAWDRALEVELQPGGSYLTFLSSIVEAEALVARHAAAVAITGVLHATAALVLRLRFRSARVLAPAAALFAVAELCVVPALVIVARVRAIESIDAQPAERLVLGREVAAKLLAGAIAHVAVAAFVGAAAVLVAVGRARARGHDPWARFAGVGDAFGVLVLVAGLAAFALTRPHAEDAKLLVERGRFTCPVTDTDLQGAPFAALDGAELQPLDVEPLRVEGWRVLLGDHALHAPHELGNLIDSRARLHDDIERLGTWRGPFPGVVLAAAGRPLDARDAAWVRAARDTGHAVRELVRLPSEPLDSRTLGALRDVPRCASVPIDSTIVATR